MIHARLSTMIYARLYGLVYVHTPIREVEPRHTPPDVEPKRWADQWEQFFNLGLGEDRADLVSNSLKRRHLAKPHRTLLFPGRFYTVNHCHRVSSQHMDAYVSIADEIRRRYYAAPKPVLDGFDSAALNIAVHVRRGTEGPNSFRFDRSDRIARSVTQSLAEIRQSDNRSPVIRVFSEGGPDDFRDFAQLGADLHLDEDPFVTFHNMVSADVLFTARSAFSYLAAILNPGIVYYERFWQPPLPGWRIVPLV